MFNTEDWAQWLADRVAEGVVSGATKYALEKIFDDKVSANATYARMLGSGIEQRIVAIWRRYSHRLGKNYPIKEDEWLINGLNTTRKHVLQTTMKRIPGNQIGHFVRLVEEDKEYEVVDFLRPYVGDPDVFFQGVVSKWLQFIDNASDDATKAYVR